MPPRKYIPILPKYDSSVQATSQHNSPHISIQPPNQEEETHLPPASVPSTQPIAFRRQVHEPLRLGHPSTYSLAAVDYVNLDHQVNSCIDAHLNLVTTRHYHYYQLDGSTRNHLVTPCDVTSLAGNSIQSPLSFQLGQFYPIQGLHELNHSHSHQSADDMMEWSHNHVASDFPYLEPHCWSSFNQAPDNSLALHESNTAGIAQPHINNNLCTAFPCLDPQCYTHAHTPLAQDYDPTETDFSFHISDVVEGQGHDFDLDDGQWKQADDGNGHY